MKIFILILLILISIQNVSAISLQARTNENALTTFNFTQQSNDQYSQIIETIPKEALVNVSTIYSIKFWCGYNYDAPPTSNLAFKFYKIIPPGIFYTIDNNYITPSQCQDSFGYTITWNFADVSIEPGYDYAFGLYSNNNPDTGGWEAGIISERNITQGETYTNASYSWVDINDGTYMTAIKNESIVNVVNTAFYYQGNSSDPVRHIATTRLYGIGVTPTPTPTATETAIPGVQIGNDTNSTIPSLFIENDFSYVNKSLPLNSTGFSSLLTSNGYAPTIAGMIAMFQDWSYVYLIVGMVLYIGKLGRWI